MPLALIALAIIGLLAFKGSPTNVAPTTPSIETFQVPQKVTTQNADSVLTKTDQEINQNMNQLDQDLKDIDTVQQEEDPNSI